MFNLYYAPLRRPILASELRPRIPQIMPPKLSQNPNNIKKIPPSMPNVKMWR